MKTGRSKYLTKQAGEYLVAAELSRRGYIATTFRFNERKDDDKGRFLKAIAGIVGKKLTWAKLTGDNDALPATA